jgi:hypothetical protein
MAFNFHIRFACALFFLKCLNVEVANAQKYSYDTPHFRGNFTCKDRAKARMVRQFLNNVEDFVLDRVFRPSNSSNTTSECTKELLKNFGKISSCKSTLYFMFYSVCLYRRRELSTYRFATVKVIPESSSKYVLIVLLWILSLLSSGRSALDFESLLKLWILSLSLVKFFLF